jgi:quinol monooxygenase YgiN
MPVFVHVTLELRGEYVESFMTAMKEIAVPYLESKGWKLYAAFLQSTGRLNTVIDIWEIEDMNHYQSALGAFFTSDVFPKFKPLLDQAVINETIVLADKASYMY